MPRGQDVKAAAVSGQPGHYLQWQATGSIQLPIGPTLHAVSFTTIASASYPQLSWFLIPFTFRIALSRMALGLHYPSDVLAGIAIGALVAGISLCL
ncbi:MAG TPA: phosphatase PAP2 family protein [Burkholderiales bacterium]